MPDQNEITELWIIQAAILYHQGATKEELLDKYGISVEYVFRAIDYEELHSDEIDELLKNG